MFNVITYKHYHLLFKSTLINSYSVTNIVNYTSLLIKGTFKKVKLKNYIYISINLILIINYNKYLIKGTLNNKKGERIKDLLLKNVTLIKSFYINIILKAYLIKQGV